MDGRIAVDRWAAVNRAHDGEICSFESSADDRGRGAYQCERGLVVGCDESVDACDSGGCCVGGETSCKCGPDADSLPFVGDGDGYLGRGRVVVLHEVGERDRPLARAGDEHVAPGADAGLKGEIARLQLALAKAAAPRLRAEAVEDGFDRLRVAVAERRDADGAAPGLDHGGMGFGAGRRGIDRLRGEGQVRHV
jgi:hypothetical protein